MTAVLQEYRIVRLTAENIKRLKVIDITPTSEGVYVIGGENGQGKTSLLDCIMYALSGKGNICELPIRAGEEKASIRIDLGDLIVTRTFTQKNQGGTLIVATKEGAKYPSPQAVLDKLLGQITFDPLAFTRLTAKDQLTTLKNIVGLDFSAFDANRKKLYDERTVINRDGLTLKAQYDAIPDVDAPDIEVSVSALASELKQAHETNAKNVKTREAAKKIDDEILRITSEIEKLQERLTNLKSQKEGADKVVADLTDIDTSSIEQKMQDAEGINRNVRKKKEKAVIGEKLNNLRNKKEDLTKQIEDIDRKKAESLSAASFPVKGLGFGETGITYNDLPFSQASSAEQLRVSVAMGMALNPQLKVMRIYDGSLLDDKSFNIVSEMAKEKGYQIFMERVGDGKECQIVIEDGTIKEDRCSQPKSEIF